MSQEMIITFSDGIYLPNQLSPHLIAEIYADLTIQNPAYYEAIRFQRSTKSIQAEIKMYKETKNTIRLPRGYLFHLIKKLKKELISYEFLDQTQSIECRFEVKNGELRGYQNDAVTKALHYKQGVIISPCGSGKTVMGVFFLAMARQRTLWITHTKDLMYQTIEQIEKLLGIPSDQIGKIGDGKKTLGEQVTVGLVQSLVNYDKKTLSDHFGTIIIDEAHRVPSKTFHQVVEVSKAKYRLGLTATPNRKDGLQSILYHVVGQAVFQITEGDLLAENRILIPDVKKIFTEFESTGSDYLKIIHQLTADEERNDLIAETIIETMKKSEVALVLSSRVEHCRILEQFVKEGTRELNTALLTGKVSKYERESIISKARNGTINVIFATQLADEGLDIPNLSKLFLATPSKSKAKIKQQLGRIMRNTDTKETPVVYDFVDLKVSILRHHESMRNVVYNELGCKLY